MSELNNVQLDKETSDLYHQLEGEATSKDEVLALREMAAADSAETSTITKNEQGDQSKSETFDVTSLGSTTLAKLNEVVVENAKPAIAVDSDTWRNEQK